MNTESVTASRLNLVLQMITIKGSNITKPKIRDTQQKKDFPHHLKYN